MDCNKLWTVNCGTTLLNTRWLPQMLGYEQSRFPLQMSIKLWPIESSMTNFSIGTDTFSSSPGYQNVFVDCVESMVLQTNTFRSIADIDTSI